MLFRKLLLLTTLLIYCGVLVGCGKDSASERRVLLATTTSTAHSGLLDHLINAFTESTGIRVDFVAVGTGAALKLGEKGDVDVVLVHAAPAEKEFISAGYGEKRIPVMYNDYVLLGPPEDPAGISKCSSFQDAMRSIAEKRAPFISRGDNSGTHMKERACWDLLGITPSGSWYTEAGQGMGGCLLLASETKAYVLSDRGTYLSRFDDLAIQILYEGDPLLYNPYTIMIVKRNLRPDGNYAEAKTFADWLVSAAGQERIAAFRANGKQLFYPDAEGKYAQ
ncbi:MAG: substrate-binding domain-containing protein [Candidatus Eisenbacteria bacterium]|uniref:Substrate-binding domain-containing protein n=1 Tax=Eiseniibacteriota bacterium TaxID=2212470 RepID=A0A948W824_UNCEI|nr:substrate-binding domain-containing protein [Candidatus Eisenbacteria bacterium]MBU1951082.1 substrate-binding domain-containing protein [Candidatus Eisenbacteria bacterium]MBU2693219.1 substrate-binding domain-containing protein [Candidatus Eisenbacteria bacterium]